MLNAYRADFLTPGGILSRLIKQSSISNINAQEPQDKHRIPMTGAAKPLMITLRAITVNYVSIKDK